jgi:hypothetical protein
MREGGMDEDSSVAWHQPVFPSLRNQSKWRRILSAWCEEFAPDMGKRVPWKEFQTYNYGT